MEDLGGQVALVTGGGRGLGRAFAMELARLGMRVAVAARSTGQVEETAAAIRGAGGTAIAVTADVTRGSDVEAMVGTVENSLEPIDLLVNNAGAGAPFGPTWELNADQWWRTVETNLKAPLLCSNAVLKGMTERRRGRIVNVASGAGLFSIPYMSAYVTSKTALIRLTEVLADELRFHRVSVFAIQPGTVRTKMAEELLESEAGRQYLPWFRKIFDEGRDDSTAPACELIVYLARGEADALSGRFFLAPGAPAEVVAHADEVRERGLNVLRMQFLP
jgi:NAD(P)-dependent dehydrogenase (short-subunit alcohol dehydrogenase family)